MAAYAALVSLMQIIHQIKNHPSPPISMEKKPVDSLTEIVSSLQGFLEGGYNSPVAGDSDGADPLEMRIADAAYAAEDVIESHIVDTIKLRMSTTARYDVQETSSCMRFNQDLRHVIKRMDVIKNEVMVMMVGVVRNDESASAVSASSAVMILESTILDPVSTNMDFNEVLEKVAAEKDDFQVIPIVGMGGIGKTTLARNIYAHPLIKDMFDVRAWVKVSQQYDTKEILCEVLSQSRGDSKETLRKMSEVDVGTQLYQYLNGRRFVIVMDDMWIVKAWESTSRYFPKTGSGTRGRVVVTTRLSELCKALNKNYSHKMRFLDEERSWELFSKTVFGVGEERSCSLELEQVGKKIVENCRGLPLSIVVVGGILRKRKQKAIWEGVLGNLTSIVSLDNDKHCLKLLKTSYHFLPVYLKPCFLYMGLFEEDDGFYGPNLIKLWVSEGFVRPQKGKSLETIAEEFLNELRERNLILVTKLGSRGNIQDFQVHDLLMDFCSREGQTQRFYHVVRPNRRQSRGNSTSRRLLITDATSEKVALDALNSMPLVRSIICEDNDKVLACEKLGLLRILSEFTNHVDEDGTLTPLAFKLVNLRHLDVEVQTEILSISHLWNLQTLIVHAYMELQVPASIWSMPLLRHIEFAATRQRLPDPPSSSSSVVMENLHTLKGVENLRFGQEVVAKLPNVKRLLIQYDHEVDSNMDGLTKLEFLTCLQEKWWRLHEPQNLTFPHLIKKLTLTTIYGDDTLRNIGALPLLQKLKLMSGSFRTGQWVIDEGQFPSLKFLKLIWCNGLKYWTAAEDARSVFPLLEQLYLSRLTQLMEIPWEIGEVPTLQLIELSFCNESAVRCVKQVQEEQEDLEGEEEISFHVVAMVDKRHQELKSLASRNFKVEVFEIS